MEMTILTPEAFASPVAFAGGLILLAVLAGGVLLGCIAEEEAKGRRLIWAEEPLPEAGKPALPEAEQLRRAA